MMETRKEETAAVPLAKSKLLQSGFAVTKRTRRRYVPLFARTATILMSLATTKLAENATSLVRLALETPKTIA